MIRRRRLSRRRQSFSIGDRDLDMAARILDKLRQSPFASLRRCGMGKKSDAPPRYRKDTIRRVGIITPVSSS